MNDVRGLGWKESLLTVEICPRTCVYLVAESIKEQTRQATHSSIYKPNRLTTHWLRSYLNIDIWLYLNLTLDHISSGLEVTYYWLSCWLQTTISFDQIQIGDLVINKHGIWSHANYIFTHINPGHSIVYKHNNVQTGHLERVDIGHLIIYKQDIVWLSTNRTFGRITYKRYFYLFIYKQDIIYSCRPTTRTFLIV